MGARVVSAHDSCTTMYIARPPHVWSVTDMQGYNYVYIFI